ncbi:MAG: M50 family metallopeptidase, partial [Clostridia bacterium]
MGPKIFSKQKGDTLYSLRLLPIGGFCDMDGETEDSGSETSFNNKPIWKRMIIVATGAILNIILGIILMSIVLVQMDLLPTVTISQFAEESKTEEYGLIVGDTIVSIDGYDIFTEKDLSFAYGTADPSSVDITVNRDGELIEFNGLSLGSDEYDGVEYVSLDFYVYGEEPTFVNIIKKSFADSYSIFRMVLASLGGIISGEFGLNEVSGPVGATKAISDAAAVGLESSFFDGLSNIIFMMAVLTINLGVFNLLPFPALDGGRFVFLLIELIFRKKVPAKYENIINTLGFVILISFMIVITFKDIFQIFF